MSLTKASWQVTIQDVTVKHDGFWTLEFPLIRQIHSFCHRRQRALCYQSCGTGGEELVVWQLGECLTGQNRTETGPGMPGHGRMRTGKTAFLGFSVADILVYRPAYLSNWSAYFFWLNILALKKFFELSWFFNTFSSYISRHIFLNVFFLLWGYKCSHWEQSSSAAFSDWPPKHWCVFIRNKTGYVLNMSLLFLKMTGLVPNVNKFVINNTGFYINIKSFFFSKIWLNFSRYDCICLNYE